MAAQAELYREVVARVEGARRGQGVRITTVRRLALLITGLVAAKSGVVSRMASGPWEAGVSAAQVASIARRLRRSVDDEKGAAGGGYEPGGGRTRRWRGGGARSRRCGG